jgi:hypothetical protein
MINFNWSKVKNNLNAHGGEVKKHDLKLFFKRDIFRGPQRGAPKPKF